MPLLGLSQRKEGSNADAYREDANDWTLGSVVSTRFFRHFYISNVKRLTAKIQGMQNQKPETPYQAIG